MKSILATTLASVILTGPVFAGDAMAANGLKIESEAQFVREYGDQVEQIGPGVYLIVAGKLAGKTVSIGEAGLAHDINVQRARRPADGAAKAQSRALIRQMEETRARYQELRARQTPDIGTRQFSGGSFPCFYRPWGGGNTVHYFGQAYVEATAELYMDNGGGGLNWYYARAQANASGSVFPPYSVPVSPSFHVGVHAANNDTGQVVQYSTTGYTSAGLGTGYVYSGPAFSHNLFAVATVTGIGNCYGYVSISDSFP